MRCVRLVIRLPLHVAENLVAAVRVLVCQLNNVIPISMDGVMALRLDDDRSIGTVGFLKAGVAVEPVGSGLLNRKLVGERGARFDTVKADPWYAVLTER